MAGFCGNCGAALEEGAKVCGHCGMPTKADNIKISGIMPDKREERKKGKRIKGILILILVLVICLGMINLISNFVGKKGLVNRIMKAYMDYDVDTLVSVSSDIYSYGLGSTAEIVFRNTVETDLDSYEATAGHDYRIHYKIDDIYESSERQKAEIQERLESTYPDYHSDRLKKIAVAEIALNVEGKQSFSTSLYIYLVNEDGMWKLLYIE